MTPFQPMPAETRAALWTRYLADLQDYAALPQPLDSQRHAGARHRPGARSRRRARAGGLGVRGARCRRPGQPGVLAEVVGFNGDRAFLMPTGELQGLTSGALVQPLPGAACRAGASARRTTRGGAARTAALHLPVGDGLLGRVVDAHGKPLDRMGPLQNVRTEPMVRRAINAMDRDPVRTPLDTGVRAINALLTVGRGQRLGLFAGTGVGKSVLLGMMARYTAADVIVVGLIGERGREVKEFIEDILEEEGRARSVVVAAPADAPPLVRMQGANYATAIAEHFRDRGPARAAADGLPDALRDGAARDRAGHRRAAGHQGLPAELLRQAAAAGGAQRQRPQRPAARSPPSTPCSAKATTRRTRSPTRRAASSTATSCCRASWPRPGTSRPSTSSARSRA